MVIAVLLAGLAQIVSIVVLAALCKRYFDQVRADYEQRLAAVVQSWVEPQSEGQPSKLALVVDLAGNVVGRAAAHSIMASIGAQESHAARAANSMADEVQARQNPILGLLAGGKRGKGAAVMRLAEMLGPMLAGGSASSPRKNGSGAGQAAPNNFRMEM